MKKIFYLLLFYLLSANINYSNDKDNVLILNSYHPDFKWTKLEIAGINNAFIEFYPKVKLYIEYLDTKNFSFEQNEKIYYELIKNKYNKITFKVIIVTDNDAFYFVKKYKNVLFKDSYVVFCGINGFTEDMIPDRKIYTGVAEKYDFESNIKLILKLFPDTKEIVSFFDATITGKLIYNEYKNATAKFKNVNFTEYINPDMDSLKVMVTKLKKGQVLLLGEMGMDAKERVFNHVDVARELSPLAQVPVFGMQQDMLRRGIIGGKLMNPFLHGRMAGTMALKIINGETPDKINIVYNLEKVYHFDYNLLKKYNINEELLPKPKIIVQLPNPIWKTNKELIIRVLIIFIFLTAFIILLLVNIYFRRKTLLELREAKDYIDKILSSLSDCVWSINLDKNLIVINSYFSPVIEKIYGYSYDEFKKNPDLWREIVLEEDKEILQENYKNLITGKITTSNFTFRIRTNEGEIKWIEQSITISDTTDGGKRFDGIAKDVTERVNQQTILTRFSKAIEQSPVSIIVTDNKGNIEYVNPNFEAITGYTFEEVNGKNPRILKSGFTDIKVYKNLWETILSGKDWKGELYNKRKNGEYFWEIAAISPIKNEKGEITNFVAVKEDITHIKNVESLLIAAKERAERADKLKDEFLAQMSHEIRTPINAILSFSGLIKDELEDKIDDDLKMAFNIMVRAGKRIIRTIDLILNMAELQTGYFKPNFVKVNVKNKIEDCIEFDFLQLAKDKNLELRFNYKSSTEELTLDEYTFEVIIKNLIDNAIKYTPRGIVEVNVFDYSDNQLAFEVKDTGIGISEEYQKNLFEPFSQEEQGYTRRFEGNGLGLALIKKYTDLNNGEITVKSKKGEGSSFTVIFNKN
jgi:PAS domain S-box-containing protein